MGDAETLAGQAAVWLAPGDLTGWDHNPQQHDVEGIARSIQELGFGTPVVARRDGLEIIAGHGRVKAAIHLGLEQIPVRLMDVDEATAHRLAIADNQLVGEMDDDLLAEVVELEGWGEDDLELLGFGEEDANWLLDIEPPPAPDPEPPEPLPESKTQRGDVIVLGGKHRVMCGDATSAEDVGVLMAGERAALCLTDPPYSVDYDRSQELRGGNMAAHAPYHESDINPIETLTFMGLVPSSLLIWTFSLDRHMSKVVDAYREHGWKHRKELVWVKDQFSFWPGSAYQQRHEPILIATRPGGSFRGSVPANQSTVMEFPRPRAHDEHATQKPIGLWVLILGFHSDDGDVVYDPFLGSGTTLIAADQLGRTCYGLEIEPRYIDVIVRRWIAYCKAAGKPAGVEGWRGAAACA